jgi:hypothetical protein
MLEFFNFKPAEYSLNIRSDTLFSSQTMVYLKINQIEKKRE